MKDDEARRVEPREIRRISTATSAYGLPADLMDTAVQRLGFLGLVIALMAPAVFGVEYLTQRERLASAGVPFVQIVAVALFVSGAAVCVLAWARVLRTELMLDLGLVFEVLVAFLIALSENATAWPPDHTVRGISWNCLWISMYVVAIPGTYGKSVLAAFAAALMAPFGLLVATAANRHPMPLPGQMFLLLLPPFVAAAWAVPVGRYLYRLGAQVNKARALGSYELVDRIGHGGMGEVWTARHRMLARVSAIKLIRPEMLGVANLESTGLLVKRFEREARATAALRSPHTVVLYDYGVSGDGSLYYVMELLDGLDLEALIERFGPQPAGRVICFLSQAAKSLAEAHSQGLVHRDIKPRNIFACRMGTDYDFVKVLDFGLVKIRTGDLAREQTSLTRAGVTTGTPAYMAPEIGMGSSLIDGRADLYSLGCVAYWLLTGQLVFEAETAMAMVLAHVQNPPVPPSLRTEIQIPAPLESIVLRCLEKDPALRPQTARELYDLLGSCDQVDPWTRDDAERWWHVHMPSTTEVRNLEHARSGKEASG